jgi:hypothetical protein
MAHFVKLGIGNKVLKVEVVSNDVATTEQAGIDFLNNLYGTTDIWKQTSYNTHGGKYYILSDEVDDYGVPIKIEATDQSKSFRKNYAGIGFKYDQTRDAFIPPKPFDSWTLNETTCLWEAPIPYPTDDQKYDWNEKKQTWDLLE